VTQSAISSSLTRLRVLLGDPLVTRSGRGLVATPRGRELQPRLTAALRDLRAAVEQPERFDPRAYERRFTIAVADGQQVCDLAPIARAMEREPPRARLRVVSIEYLIANDALTTGDPLVTRSGRGLPAIAFFARSCRNECRGDAGVRVRRPGGPAPECRTRGSSPT
jgi:DNA-binding transcriptional LysR family regulator